MRMISREELMLDIGEIYHKVKKHYIDMGFYDLTPVTIPPTTHVTSMVEQQLEEDLRA